MFRLWQRIQITSVCGYILEATCLQIRMKVILWMIKLLNELLSISTVFQHIHQIAITFNLWYHLMVILNVLTLLVRFYIMSCYPRSNFALYYAIKINLTTFNLESIFRRAHLERLNQIGICRTDNSTYIYDNLDIATKTIQEYAALLRHCQRPYQRNLN